MTRVSTPALCAVAQRAASLLVGALIIFGLAACESMGSGGASLTAAATVPKPKPSVAFAPVQGVPTKYAAKVNEQLVASAKQSGLQVVEEKDADYTVKGAFVALPEARKGTKLTYAFDITDKTGKRVQRLEGEELVSQKRGGDSWSHVNDEAIQKVVAKSTAELNGWIENPNAPAGTAMAANETQPNAAPAQTANAAPSTAPHAAPARSANTALAASVTMAATQPKPQVTRTAAVAPASLVAVVLPVTGAPGDGKSALSEAMKKHLAAQGVKLASSTSGPAYKVQGKVEMGAADNGEQPITIRWTVADPQGNVLDNAVVQRNKVPAHSLDGTWGPVADAAAGEAAKAVAKLINKPSGQAS